VHAFITKSGEKGDNLHACTETLQFWQLDIRENSVALLLAEKALVSENVGPF
jgi:hypothetical protein